MGFLAAFGAIYAVWLIGPVASAGDRSIVATLTVVPAGLFAAGVAFLAAGDRSLDRGARRSWLLLAAALSASAVGSVVTAVAAVAGWAVPFPSVVDVVKLVFYPLTFVALITFPASPGAAADRVRLAFDVAIWVIGGGLLVGLLVFGPGIAAAGGDLAAAATTLGYPIGALIVLAGLATAAMRRPQPVHRRPLALLLLGIAALFIDDVARSALSAAHAYVPGHPVDALWMASTLLIAAAAIVQRRDATDVRLRTADPGVAPRVGISLMPYVFLTAGYWALLHDIDPAFSRSTVAIAIGSTLLGVLVIGRQVVSLREQGRLLRLDAERRSAARFSTIVRDAPDALLVVESDGAVRYASPAVERIFGVTPSSVAGRPLADLLEPDTAARLLTDRPLRSRPLSVAHQRPDGRRFDLECAVSDFRDDPAVEGYAVTLRDVTERRSLQDRLTFQAFHDPLTGLANRALLHDRLDRALHGQTGDAGGVGLLMIDLDDFRRVNDAFGHVAGDRLLVQVADRLHDAARSGDTVARLGGDEFAVLIADPIADPPAPSRLDDAGDRVLDVINQPFLIDGRSIHITASIGSLRGAQPTTADEILRDADVALNTAKARGKARRVPFEPSQRDLARTRLGLELDLRGAAGRGEIALEFQPVVDLATSRATGLEALARWRHPRIGEIPPATFIALAESSGLIVALGRWILLDACRRLAAIRRDSGLTDLTVAVNVSAVQLDSPDFLDDVSAALEANGLTPRDLVLEITETGLIRDGAVGHLAALRRSGVQIAVDDFGTGYSSLAYLQRLPVDVLKIDKAFVARVDGSASGRSLVTAIVQIARALGVRTIAEGVERPEQAELLAAIGCDRGQGYWYARPMDPDRLGPVLAALGGRGRPGVGRRSPMGRPTVDRRLVFDAEA